MDEVSMRSSHRERLRRLLSDGRWHTMAEMEKAGGMRYGGRVHELRHKTGVTVESRKVGPDEWEYRMTDGEVD